MPIIPASTVRELTDDDAIIVGKTTRFGTTCWQMRQFFDAAGSLRNAGGW